MSTIIQVARDFATAAHDEVNHTYDRHPYAYHLEMVAVLADRFGYLLLPQMRDLAVAGAWVHDVIEDARQSYNDVRKATNVDVADIAYACTNEKGRTRQERANARYYHGLRLNPVAHFVKICDRIANVEHSAFATKGHMLNVYRHEAEDFEKQMWCANYSTMFDHLRAVLAMS